MFQAVVCIECRAVCDWGVHGTKIKKVAFIVYICLPASWFLVIQTSVVL